MAPRETQTWDVETLDLPLPAGHPSTHGRVRLRLRTSAATAGREVVTAAEVVVGAVHRGAEKLLEVRDYRQGLVLVDRHDWWGAFGSELGFALAVERMVGIRVPRRAQVVRTILAELTRCASHLAFLSGAMACTTTEEGAHERVTSGVALVRSLVEAASGNRLHPMMCRVGGLATDVDQDWSSAVRSAVAPLRDAAGAAGAGLGIVGGGVAPLPAATAIQYAVTGPSARASGVAVDLRVDEPYVIYEEVFSAADVVTRAEGDAAARWAVMAEEVVAATRVVERCLDLLAPGPISSRTPRTLRVPEGATFVWTESPQGASGYYLVSGGDTAPLRVKIRSSTYDSAAVLAAVLVGTPRAELPFVLASFPLISGDVDR